MYIVPVNETGEINYSNPLEPRWFDQKLQMPDIELDYLVCVLMAFRLTLAQ